MKDADSFDFQGAPLDDFSRIRPPTFSTPVSPRMSHAFYCCHRLRWRLSFHIAPVAIEIPAELSQSSIRQSPASPHENRHAAFSAVFLFAVRLDHVAAVPLVWIVSALFRGEESGRQIVRRTVECNLRFSRTTPLNDKPTQSRWGIVGVGVHLPESAA